MNRYLILLSIGIISFGIVDAAALEWNGTPSKTPIYHDPVREYYDMKQTHSIHPTEPVYYSGFEIDPIPTVECDSWIPVYGIVPDEGLLFFTIISGDYMGFANVSHNSNYYLMNYFYLPCTGASQAQLNITYIWNDNDDKEFYPNTKVKDMGIDRHFLQISETFKIK